ncbi:MAG: glucosamine-6-phosphate deaminase, partial [Sphingobacteriales bacterium]
MAALRTFIADKLQVNIYDSRVSMGQAAGSDVAAAIRSLLTSIQGSVHIIFAAAPSQQEFLYQLSQEPGID